MLTAGLLSSSWTPGRPPFRRPKRSVRCVASTDAQPPPLESAARLLDRVMQLPEVSSELLPHGELLDEEARQRVQHGDVLDQSWMPEHSIDEQLSMHFVRTFLSLSPHTEPAELFVTGGYVRDLLRGKAHHSDDLDLSICLRGCAGNVTITNLMAGLPAFAKARPDLGVKEVKVATTLSAAAQEKGVDCAKVTFTLIGGERVPLDFMPTIGAEFYDTMDRVPRRNQRGTAREDSLRRDLAVSSMLLRVRLPEGHATDSGVFALGAARANAQARQHLLGSGLGLG